MPFYLISSDHIDHIKNVSGIDHVGLGSDYDGVPRFARLRFSFQAVHSNGKFILCSNHVIIWNYTMIWWKDYMKFVP